MLATRFQDIIKPSFFSFTYLLLRPLLGYDYMSLYVCIEQGKEYGVVNIYLVLFSTFRVMCTIPIPRLTTSLRNIISMEHGLCSAEDTDLKIIILDIHASLYELTVVFFLPNNIRKQCICAPN